VPGPRPAGKDRIAAKVERDIRRAEAVRLAVDGVTYEEIAERLGYSSRQAAHRDVKAGLAPARKALEEAGKELIAVQAARLEQMYRDARAIFAEYGGDGDEYSDKQDQRLAAMDRMLKVSESTRKLLGLDAPTKTENRNEISGTVGYQVAVTSEELDQL
jgi:AraC-like DNA-binding protein